MRCVGVPVMTASGRLAIKTKNMGTIIQYT
jgi:hypothetical protein